MEKSLDNECTQNILREYPKKYMYLVNFNFFIVNMCLEEKKTINNIEFLNFKIMNILLFNILYLNFMFLRDPNKAPAVHVHAVTKRHNFSATIFFSFDSITEYIIVYVDSGANNLQI